MAGKESPIDHMLGLHAHSFYHFPARSLYDDAEMSRYRGLFDKCHVYMLGYYPEVKFLGSKAARGRLRQRFSILDKGLQLDWPMSASPELATKDPLHPQNVAQLYAKFGKADFSVQYIGQAYGSDGSRVALDRLFKHETLQRMAIEGAPAGYQLQILLVEVYTHTEVLSAINPFKGSESEFLNRLQARELKILGTSAIERISLYEASLIRYFQPKYNKVFKDRFPSTNHKILSDCYDKEFRQIAAEFTFDDMPITLSSPTIPPAETHFVLYDLQTSESRQAFFDPAGEIAGHDAFPTGTATAPKAGEEFRIVILPD